MTKYTSLKDHKIVVGFGYSIMFIYKLVFCSNAKNIASFGCTLAMGECLCTLLLENLIK